MISTNLDRCWALIWVDFGYGLGGFPAIKLGKTFPRTALDLPPFHLGPGREPQGPWRGCGSQGIPPVPPKDLPRISWGNPAGGTSGGIPGGPLGESKYKFQSLKSQKLPRLERSPPQGIPPIPPVPPQGSPQNIPGKSCGGTLWGDPRPPPWGNPPRARS